MNKITFSQKKIGIRTIDMQKLFETKEYEQFEGIRKKKKYSEQSTEAGNCIINDSPPMVLLFDSMLKDSGTIISQADYVRNVYSMITENMKEIHKGKLTNDVKDYIFNRIKKAYMGFVAEYHALLMIVEKIEDVIILTNTRADLRAGIDFVLISLKNDKIYDVHVTSMKSGEEYLVKKEKRGRNRDFTRDVVLLYNPSSDDQRSYQINTFPFFREKYIKRKFADWEVDQKLGTTLDNSKLKKMMESGYRNWELTTGKINSKEKYNQILEKLKAF